MGCYITGNVNIGNDGQVNNILIKCCSFNEIKINNSACLEIFVNQNYIRGRDNTGGNSNLILKNNIMKGIRYVNGGIIQNNIFTHWSDAYAGSLNYIYNSIVTNNVITNIWKDNPIVFNRTSISIFHHLFSTSVTEVTPTTIAVILESRKSQKIQGIPVLKSQT